MTFKPQVHIEPYAACGGTEYVEMHTYDTGTERDMALVTVHGSNMDRVDVTVELWLTEDEVRAIRNGLNEILGEKK